MVSVDIKNTGKRTGDEVVQLYIRRPDSTINTPLKELKGFKRITLTPGEVKTVRLSLKPEAFTGWNAVKQGFELVEGEIKIMVGSSSQDIKLERQIRVMKSE